MISRIICAVVLAVWVAAGCRSLHVVILPLNWVLGGLRDKILVGNIEYFTLGYLIAGVLCLAGWIASYLFIVNNPRLVDYLIKTEAEMKKVSWPSRREVVISAAVVLVLIIILGGYMFGIDKVISSILFKAIGGDGE